MEETLRQTLLDAASAMEAANGTTPATIGKRALNDNTFFARISDGQGFTIKTFDRVMGWMSANWPEDAERPASLNQTAPAAEDAA